jgi:hypothetical protein
MSARDADNQQTECGTIEEETQQFCAPRERDEKENKEQNKTTRAARFDFLKALVENGVDSSVAADYITTRKAKKCVQTETAFGLFASEANKSGLTIPEAVSLCCKRGWGGFDAAWVKPEDRTSAAAPGYVIPDFMRGAI